jgi:N utilization substance protein B
MINRHFLRVKILQALYAYYLSLSSNMEKAEKELFESINGLYHLEVCFFSIIIELKYIEEKLLDAAKYKYFPKESDLNPNMKFVNNAFIAQLEANKELKKTIEKYKLNWNEFYVILKNILDEIKESELYRKYMVAKELTYKDEKKFIVNIFMEFIITNEKLHDILFDKESSWESDYFFVSDYFLKYLRSIREEDDENKPLLHPFEKPLTDEQSDEDYVISMFRNTIVNYDEYDKMINVRLENWDRERLAFMDTLVIKMGMVELVYCRTIPIRVTLNECIELAKEFSTPRSRLFVNGMLDRLLVDLRSRGLIQKEGRGLETMEEYENMITD